MASVLLLSLITLVLFILLRGSSYFWPVGIQTLQYLDTETALLTQVYGQAQAVNKRQTYAERTTEQPVDVDSQLSLIHI